MTRAAIILLTGLMCVSCATVEEGLRTGNIYDACMLVEEGTFPFGDIDYDDRELVREHVEGQAKVTVEELDWSSDDYMGEPLEHDELVLFRLRIALPKGVRAPQFDDSRFVASFADDIRAALPPLTKPTPEVVPPGPLVIPDPPKNPVYRPPARPRRKGLMDAFVSLLTLPADLVRAGVEVAVAVIKIPFEIANGMMRGGRVRVGGASAPEEPGLTPAHRSPMFKDALLNEEEWRTLVDAATERYDDKLALYNERKRLRDERIERIETIARKRCDLTRSRTCEVIRIQRRETTDKRVLVFCRDGRGRSSF